MKNLGARWVGLLISFLCVSGLAVSPPPFPSQFFFFTPDLDTLFISPPIAFSTNLISVEVDAWPYYSDALILDTTNLTPAYLEYYVQDTNGNNNFSYDPGTVLFYFAPNWASVSQGGTGPGETAYFFGSGDWSSNSPNGLMALYTDAGGSNIYFGGVSNGVAVTYASAPISWASNSFHQIGVEWTTFGNWTLRHSKIYLDGALAVTGSQVSIVPQLGTDTNGVCTNGFFIGSDDNGYEQARGAFWGMTTWTLQYGGSYAGGWLSVSNALAAWQTSFGGGGFGGMMGMGAGLGYISGVTYTTNYSDYTNFWLTIGASSSATQAVVTIQNTQSNLTYNILTNSVLDPNPADWGVWQTLTASNSVLVAPQINFGANTLFFDASLVWSTTTNGLPDWWQMEYFGNLNQPANGDYDGDGVTDWQNYTNGADPNKISFQIWFTNQYVNLTNVPLWLGIQGGVPSFWAMTLDNSNFSAATWSAYTSSNITANLGAAQGWHTVWVGLRGLPADALQTWISVQLYLDFTTPSLDAQATLYGLTNGMVISNVVNLPVALATPSGQLTTLTLEDSGVPIASSIHNDPFEVPAPIMVLDTAQMSNGVHSISVHAFFTDPGDGTEDGSGAIYEADSPAVTVTVSNEISFPNWMPQFGEMGNSLLIRAQSAHTNAEWYLDVYDSQYNYIGTMWGITPDGNIDVVWNLIGPDETPHTDNTFEFVLTTVYDDPVVASRPLPPSYKVTDPWSGPGDWVVVNQQAWNSLVGNDELDIMADGFTVAAQALGLTVRPSTSGGTSYRIRYADPANAHTDWANFRSALYNGLSRNLFYLGHGGPNGLGATQTTTNLSILATEIGTVLRTIPAGQTNSHKYRFVCLDGCSTAGGALPEAFGIIHKQDVSGSDYAYASLRPSAFAGWDNDQPIGAAGSVNTSHVYFFQHFLYRWGIGDGVKAAFDNAAAYPDVAGLGTSHLKVFGYWFLGVNQFNH